MDYVKVKDNEHLVRNSESNCIVNTNKAEYEEYLTRRKLKKSEKNKVDNLERDISTLRNEIIMSTIPINKTAKKKDLII